ncbi:MAG: hypothetical protein QXH10_03285 [Ignisphaera sp.]|uniref:Uncharacterized protein n=2 Tax=Ignisphaera aggregans TaxID=334771 RepID=A0A832CRK3_9CREN
MKRALLIIILLLLLLIPLITFLINSKPLHIYAQPQVLLDVRIENVEIPSGSLVVPHLYTWLFTGKEEQHIRVHWTKSYNTTAYAIALRSPWASYPYFMVFRRIGPYGVSQCDFYYGSRPAGVMLVVRVANKPAPGPADAYYLDPGYPPPKDTWIHAYVDYNATYHANLYLYEYKTLNSTSGGTPLIPASDPLYLGARGDQPTLEDVRNVYDGYMRWFILWDNTKKSTSEMIEVFRSLVEGKTVDMGNVEVFVDPTFFNSTHYLDLSKNRSPVYHNPDVKRELDAHRWLWLLKGLYTDTKLYFRFLNQIREVSGGKYIRIVITSAGTSKEYWVDTGDEFSIDLVKEFGSSKLSSASITIEAWSDKPGAGIMTVTRTVTETVTHVSLTSVIQYEFMYITDTKTVRTTVTRNITQVVVSVQYLPATTITEQRTLYSTQTVKETLVSTITQTSTSEATKTVTTTAYEVPGWTMPSIIVLILIVILLGALYMTRGKK